MKKVQIIGVGRAPTCIYTRRSTVKAAGAVDRSAKRRLILLAAITASGVLSNRGLAASGSWTGATDPNWADANWSASPVPGVADTATFNNAGGFYTTIDLGSGVTVNNILFDSANAAAYTIGNYSAGTQTLSLNTSGGITMNSTVANNELFNAGIVLGTNANAASYTITNNSLSNSLTLAGNISGGATGGTAGTETLIVGGAGSTVVGGSLLNGGAGQTLALTKIGTGTLTFNGATNASLVGAGAGGGALGTVAVNSGTLVLDYSNFGAVGNANLLNSYTPVSMGGGTLQIIGNAGNASSQSFANAVFTSNAGLNTISLGANSPTLTLGTFNQSIGSQTVFNGPAYYNGASTTGVTTPTPSNASTGTITTTTLGNQNNLLWPTSRAGIATVGLYNWASVVTTPAGTHSILSGDQVTGFYAQVAAGGTAAAADTNYDLLGNATASSATTWYTDTLRFNVPGAFSFNTTTAGTNHITLVGGILVTPNVGANNTTIANGGSYLASADSTVGNCPIDVYQNNTAGELIINPPFYYYSSTSRATCFVQGGAGTVNLTGQTTLDGNYGATYLNGGTTIISDNSQLGRVATNATLNLNGGTVAGALTNLSLATRPVALGGNGGGLSAFTGTTLTVGGFISGAIGTGPLVIGIPASAANGNNTAGLVPGTGTGTANAANYAAGTVVLSASAGNGYYGGTTIVGGAKLNINSEYQLGGADQGPVTFNNGTLQYATTLLNAITDITQNTGGVAQTVTFAAGGGIIDTNGHAIVYNNPIGGNGTGGFSLTDSQAVAASRGSLTLNGPNSYTGPTSISAGTLILAAGSSLASSSVTVNSGAFLQAKGNVSAGPGMLTLSSGSSFSMVDNTISTVTAGGLNISAGSLLSYEFTGATNDKISTTLNGGLTINGGTFNLSAGSSSGALPLSTDGTYTLISYVGSDTISGGNTDTALNADLKVGNPVYGLTYAFHDTGAGAIQLLVTGVAATSGNWITDGSGSWATAGNWSSSAIPNSPGSAASLAGAAATHNQLIRSISLDGNKTVGTLFLDSPNGESYLINQGSGGSLNFNTGSSSSAAITVNAGSHYIYAPVTLSSNLDITTTGTSTLAIGGNLGNATGTNTVTKDGTGTLLLSGSNTYGPAAGTVGTTINSGTIQIGSSGAFSTGDISITAPLNPVTLQATAGVTVANNINISSGVTVTVDTQANSLEVSGAVIGSGSGITKIGTGTLTISGSDTYTGTTNVSAGTLQLGNGGTSGSVSGNILDSSALVLNRTDDYALGNVISGTGTLTKNGTDNVTLTGTNTFTGTTVIAAGSLTTGNALALQSSTLNYNNQGGTLSFGTLTSATIGGLTGSQNLTLANTTPALVALTFGGSGINSYTGTLSGGGSLTMNATGTQTIGSGTAGGANYSGGITVNNGTLVLGGVTNISGGVIGLTGLYGASNLTIADSAQVNSSSTLYLEDLPLNQGSTQYYPASSTLLVKGNSQLTVAGLSFGVPTGTRVVSSTVTVQETATLTVNGAFNLEQTAGSTASNNTVNLNGGTLAVQNFLYSGGGGGTGTTQVANLQFNGGTLKALASDPAGSSFLPNFGGVPADVDAGGAIVNTNSFNVTIAAPLLHNTGTATDGGLTKTGAGVLSLTANATYNGPTVISAGTLRLGVQGALVASYSFDNTTTTPVGSPATIVNTGAGGSAMNGTVQDTYLGINIVSGGPKINGNNGNGNSLQFTGDGSAVVIGSGIENLSGNSSWTISTWIQTTQAGATILSKNTGGTWTTGNSVFYLSNGSGGTAANTTTAAGVIPSVARNNAGYETAALTANVADGNWHMVTYVDNAGTKSIYIDGVLSALSQNGLGTAADVGTQVQLGYSPDTTATDGTAQLQGNLDDINFFSSALTATQIQNLMATNSAYGGNPNSAVNTLLPTTTVNITTAGASLDVNGSVQAVASLTGVTGSTVILGGGVLTVGNGTNTTFAGNITDSGGASALTGGSLVKQGTGTLTLSGSNTYTGGTNVSAGTLVLASVAAFSSGASQAGTGLIVGSGATLQIANHGSGATYVPIASSLTNAGTIDLTNNAMIVRNGSIGTINAQVAAAYNGGNWNGSGASGVITSSLAAADAAHLTAVGVATGLTSTFEGVSVSPADVLVKYTFYGDANLDGKVDGTDYSRIDNGYLGGLTGWQNGDFNYDGVINGSDYTLIDNAFNTQGAQLLSEVASPTAQIAGAGPSSAVPEPASLGLIGVGVSMLLGRRRRSRNK